jgi:hypothetical protein
VASLLLVFLSLLALPQILTLEVPKRRVARGLFTTRGPLPFEPPRLPQKPPGTIYMCLTCPFFFPTIFFFFPFFLMCMCPYVSGMTSSKAARYYIYFSDVSSRYIRCVLTLYPSLCSLFFFYSQASLASFFYIYVSSFYYIQASLAFFFFFTSRDSLHLLHCFDFLQSRLGGAAFVFFFI